MKWSGILVVSSAVLLGFSAGADVKMPAFFSSSMVLQRDARVNLWGTADNGESVTVSFKGQSRTVTAKDGRWMVTLDPMKADSKGETLTVKGKNQLTFTNVVTGDVWICSGQSNMEWSLAKTENAAEEQKNADLPMLRLFDGRLYRASMKPQDDIPGKTWQVCSPRNAGAFSAVGYFFGRDLCKELDVPIGLISVNWGGTRIEPWTSIYGFSTQPSLKNIYNTLLVNVPGTPQSAAAYKKAIEDMEKWVGEARKAAAAGQVLPDLPVLPNGLRFTSQQQPVVLFNTMIHPLLKFAFKGAIWYQGCANVGDGALYKDKMKALVASWRKEFGKPDMPFYFVQLAPFNYGSPFFESLKMENGKAVVTFRNAKELKTRDGKAPKYFEIAGLDHVFHPADVVLSGNRAILSSGKVSSPYMVRYAWNHNVMTNLVNENNLPAGAFRASIPISIRSVLDRLVPEAENMEIVYAVNAKNIWSGGFPAYLQDNSRKLAGRKLKSIGYFMYLVGANGGEHFAYASMDPFTQEIAKLGLPTAAGKIFFQQIVKNLYVKSNVPGLSSGKFEDGNIEFWSGSYTQKNSANVPGASDQVFDFGDSGTSLHDGYGSFQLHNYRLKQTVFAMNNFRAPAPDVGIGNNRQGNPDYTFSASSKNYTVATLLILVEAE